MSRALRICAVIVGIALIAASALVATGRVQFNGHGPFFGFEQLWTDPSATARDPDPKQTVADGADGGRVDLAGRAMDEETVGELPDGDQQRRMNIRGLGRLQAPSVRMDVALNTMDVVDDIATPPGFRAAYALSNRGTGLADPAGGRTIVVMHSAMRSHPPGNFLIDTKIGRTVLRDGAEVVVNGRAYRVERSESVDKKALADRDDVWGDDPGTLVLITCRQAGGAKTTQNTVIWARLVQ